MPDLEFARDRLFPTIDLAKDPLVLVVPDEMAGAAATLRLQQALQSEILPQRDFDETLFRHSHVIACGHFANNAALCRLYTARCCFVDTFFPGPDGYFIKSVSDPFGYGRNCIVVGASSNRDLEQALAIFTAQVAVSDGILQRVHAHRFAHDLPPLPDESQLRGMIEEQLAIWSGGWSASPFRGAQLRDYMWHYYLTDHPVWGRVIPPVFAASIDLWRAERRAQPEGYHCFFHLHSFIHLWDLIEDSPLYSQQERRGVVTLFGDFLHHLAGLFYLREEVNPPALPRQNHSTFIALNLAVGHDYMQKRYDIAAFAPAQEAVERIFAGQADSYKANDDGGVGYAWHVPQETLYFLLYRNDYRYIDAGPVADLCKLAALTTDNMRSEASYGDASGYSAHAGKGWGAQLLPLMAATWRRPDPQHLWLLNWLGAGKTPSMEQVLFGLYAAVDIDPDGFTLDGVEPQAPVNLLGISYLPLPEPARRWVRHWVPTAHHPREHGRYFDKLSLRPGFDPAQEYLLLEGTGTYCHGHEDSNAILRLSWNNRAWLADGDYIRAAPKYHNAITVQRDGIGVLESPGEGLVAPPLAALNQVLDGPDYGLVQSEVPRYNGVDWRRHIFWGKGRFFAVVDQLHCNTAGTYDCRCLWRLIGAVEGRGATTRLDQQGEQFFVRNADGAAQEVVPDRYEAGLWNGYPYADPVPQVLHQQATRTLEAGENLVFANLLTPHADIQLERLDDLLFKVLENGCTTLLGVGPARLGEMEIEGALWTIAQAADGLQLQGVEQLRWDSHQRQFDGTCHTLAASDTEVAAALRTALSAPAPRPPQATPAPRSKPASGGLEPVWNQEFLNAEIAALSVRGDHVLVAARDGQVAHLSSADGTSSWHARLDEGITALLLADIDQDGTPEALVGTTNSELVVMDGSSGRERWRRPLQNLAGPAAVSALAVADLDGSGQPRLLAGTAGWYVNAFADDGEPLWANWFRYHVITALAAADVDGDGRAEIIVGNVYSTPLTVHNFDGSFRWSTFEQVGAEGNATTPRRGIGLTQLQLWDADGDATREIAYGTADGWIYVVEPREGAAVWHANIAGQVTGLLATPAGLLAASEYGDLYCFTEGGRIRWHTQVAAWIRGFALLGEELIVAAEEGTLLRCDLQGKTTGALTLEGEIQQLIPCDSGVLCALQGGRLDYIAIGGSLR